MLKNAPENSFEESNRMFYFVNLDCKLQSCEIYFEVSELYFQTESNVDESLTTSENGYLANISVRSQESLLSIKQHPYPLIYLIQYVALLQTLPHKYNVTFTAPLTAQ